jgi:hypothetical protein
MIPASTPRALAVGAILIAFASAGHAAPTQAVGAKTTVRYDNHPGFGRILVDTNGAHLYQFDRIGDHVIVRFDPDITLTGVGSQLPRNGIAIEIEGSAFDLTVRHGSEVRSTRIGGRFALDIMDPKPQTETAQSAHSADNTTAPKQLPSQ